MLVGCWLAFLHALVNVVELTGKLMLIASFYSAAIVDWFVPYLAELVYIYRYILEGKELEFYMKKLQRKKGKGGAGAAA